MEPEKTKKKKQEEELKMWSSEVKTSFIPNAIKGGRTRKVGMEEPPPQSGTRGGRAGPLRREDDLRGDVNAAVEKRLGSPFMAKS